MCGGSLICLSQVQILFCIVVHCIGTDEIPRFFLSLKNHFLAQAVKILFLSFTCENICVAMVTNMISQLQESFLLRCTASSFEILCRYFISVYKISRTLHGHLGIWILSSSAESISHLFASLTPERYFQHSKIKFVSLCGHVISFIYIYIYLYCSILFIKAQTNVLISGRRNFLRASKLR